jgi:hypothetical protein
VYMDDLKICKKKKCFKNFFMYIVNVKLLWLKKISVYRGFKNLQVKKV